MMQPEDYDRYPLLRDHTPLIGINQPRITFVTQDGFATDPDGRNDGWSILATQRLLSDKKYNENILHLIGARLRLDPDVWTKQRRFLSRLFALFFNDDGPAWVIIAPRRITIESRQKDNCIIQSSSLDIKHQYVDRLENTSSNSKIVYPYLRLSPTLSVTTRDLQMAPRQGNRLDHSMITYQIVERELIDPHEGLESRIHEQWTFLSVGSMEEQVDARAVRIPAMRQFFDPETRIHAAGHISLNKLSECGKLMKAVSFDLYPCEDRPTGDGKPGQIIAFRSMTYPMEFYLRTNINNNTLLIQSVTEGSWGDFP